MKCKRKDKIFNIQYPQKITVIISLKKKKDMTRNLDETFISANDQWNKQKSFTEEEHCLSLILWEIK